MTSGIYGTVQKIDENKDIVLVDITDKVQVRLARNHVAEVVSS